MLVSRGFRPGARALWTDHRGNLVKKYFSLDQIVGTFVLVISILAVTDSKNEVVSGIVPIFVGMSIAVVGLAFGHNCGFSLNPARDFGPR